MSAQELADLVPCSLDHVRHLEALGLLVPEDQMYDSTSVHLVRLMDGFKEVGVSLDDVAVGSRQVSCRSRSGCLCPSWLNLSNEQKDALIYQKAADYTELVASIVPWLQRRHREYSVLAYVVSVTEEFMEERGIRPPQPSQPPAIAFLDLTGYTAVAEEHGDQAAADLATDLAAVVNQAAKSHDGRAVKWLGDGVMFHFADPGRAVLAGLDLVEETEHATRVPARIGINAGPVIAQEGDYFGRTVNIAARIADYARPHEVLASEETRTAGRAEAVEFELIGDVELKGVSESVRLHRVLRL